MTERGNWESEQAMGSGRALMTLVLFHSEVVPLLTSSRQMNKEKLSMGAHRGSTWLMFHWRAMPLGWFT